MSDVRFGIDVGGTFTDAVLLIEDKIVTAKSPTTENFSDGVIAACELAAQAAGTNFAELLPEVSRFGLGTTVVTNAITSRKGVRVGLLTTRGFEETLHHARGKYEIEDLRLKHGAELAALEDIAGIDERIDRNGAVIRPLVIEEAIDAAGRLIDAGVDALAVSFLWSIVNPAHEEAVVAAIRANWPDISVTAGSSLLPVQREYERTTLAVLNSYVSASCGGIDKLRRRLEQDGMTAPLLLVHSGGGTISADEALRQPVLLAESGPAAGVMAAAAVASRSGATDCISCDMGGTSFDVSDITDATPSRVTRGELMGVWTALPRVDVESIGAGGGSIAWIDARGLLRVGPQSAGSHPGPVCYGKGGTEPTVTDALVVLGFIDPENFLGGVMVLDRGAALEACARAGARLGLDGEAAAWGIREIAVAEMTKAVRTRLALRGLDPRKHSLVSFGGCASLFTADIADALSAPKVIIPQTASVLSALGAATMGMRRERVRSLLKTMPVEAAELAAIGEELSALVIADLAADGISPEDRAISLEVDLRFFRQNWDLSVPLDTIAFDDRFAETLLDRFKHEYAQRYGAGSISLGTPVEVVALRAVGTGPSVEFGHGETSIGRSDAEYVVDPVKWRDVRSGAVADARTMVGIFDDAILRIGQKLVGPALIERKDTAIWVPEGMEAFRDASGSILLERS